MFKRILKSNQKTLIFYSIGRVMCNWLLDYLCFCCADDNEKKRADKLRREQIQKSKTPTGAADNRPKADRKSKKQTTDHWIREIESFYGTKEKFDNRKTTEVGDIDPGVTPSEIPDAEITTTYELPFKGYRSIREMMEYLGYEFQSQVGKGGFGLVRKCYHLDKKTGTKRLLACKEIILYRKHRDIRNLKSELYVLRKCRHPFIIQLVDHFIISTGHRSIAFIFMEFADGDTLQTEINSGPLSDQMAKYYFVQTAIALCYLHKLRIAHKDLKPENILLVINNEKGSKEVRLADFGLSQNVYKAKEGVIKSGHFGGTRGYMAPEILRLEVYREHRKTLDLSYDPFRSDMWALGVCLFEMLTKILPFEFHNIDQMFTLQEEKSFGYPRSIRDTIDPDADDLIRHLLEPDVNKRIDPIGVLTHPWIKNEVDWSLINIPQESKEQNKT